MSKDEKDPDERNRRRLVVLKAIGRIAALATTAIAVIRRWLDG